MFVLDGTNLPNPNSYSKSTNVIGGFVTTLLGGIRRAIRNKKYVHELGWTNLSSSDLTTILAIYNKDTTVTFINSDLGIDTTVHVDVSDDVINPGMAEYLRQYSIILTEA